MGKALVEAVHRDAHLVLAGAFEQSGNPYIGQDVGTVCGLGEIGLPIAESLEAVIDQGDVLIDFTFHAATLPFAEIVAQHHKAMVIGTTGHIKTELAGITELAQAHFPCVLASNMAIGVNVLFKLVEQTAAILGDAYDVEIIEAHHNKKKDAPSGTAKTLGELAANALGRDLARDGVFARHGLIGERTTKEIGIQTIRGGDIIGDHTVYFIGEGERLELTHRAASRTNFAQGATRAARWIVGKANGVYSMFDVLGL